MNGQIQVVSTYPSQCNKTWGIKDRMMAEIQKRYKNCGEEKILCLYGK
jgi:hypothetical protein